MTNHKYSKGYLRCRRCDKWFKEEDCPLYKSKKQTYRVCPECPSPYKLRGSAHNKNFNRHKDPIWLESRKF